MIFIFLNAGLARKGEADLIEESREHQNNKNILNWHGQQT